MGIAWGVLLFYGGLVGRWVRWAARPARHGLCCITPADLGCGYEEVTLKAADRMALSGWYIPSQNGAAVILLHGYGPNRVQMVKRSGLLAAHGYAALLYDQRASGESEGETRWFGWADVEDMPAALEFLAEREEVDPERVGILGFSLGGQIVLRAAAEIGGLGAVVAQEPGFSTAEDLLWVTTRKERWGALTYRLEFKGLEWWTGVRKPSGVVDSLPRIAPRPVLFIAAGPVEAPGYRSVRHFYDTASDPSGGGTSRKRSTGKYPMCGERSTRRES